MAGGKFDPQLFFQRAENIALNIPASDVFSLMKRSLDLPGSWAALVTGKAGEDRVIPAGASVEGAEVADVLFVRITAFDVSFEFHQLRSRDGLICHGDVQLRVRLVLERGDLVSFRRTLQANHRVIQTEDLAHYFEPVVQSSLSQFAADHEACDLVDAQAQDVLSTTLTKALEGPCFSAGLVLDGPPAVRFESSSLRQVQKVRADAARRHAEHQAAQELRDALQHAQHDHLDHLSSLLTRLNELARKSPDVELPELIRTFAEHQRGELYGALFAADTTTAHTQWIVVAAGDEMILFDPTKLDQPARRIPITGSAGAVRSVQYHKDDYGQRFLLLGAATGVYRLPLDQNEPDLTLIVQHAPEVRGGFNSVVRIGSRVLATHSEIGIYQWDTHDPSIGRLIFESITRGAKAVRFIQQDGGDLYCAVDDKILRWCNAGESDEPSRMYPGSGSTITALRVCGDGVFAGNSQGEVLHWPIGGDPRKPKIWHRGNRRAVESISMLCSQGIRRLIFTDTSLYVHARVLGDTFTCRYEAGGQTLRRVEVAPDRLVATNELRDRLILWKPGQPDRPEATIAVSRLCGRSVQDVCLVPVS